MKIAYIGPSGVFGGVRAIVEHCNHLARRGHDVTFISVDNRPIEWLKCEFTQRPAADPGAGYDVAVGSAIGTWDRAAQLGARPFGLFQMAEWLFFPQGSDDAHRQRDMFLRAPVEVLAISGWLADTARQAGKTVHKIRNGIDLAQFYPDPPRPDPHPRLRILIEGYSNNPAKDWDCMAFRAARKLRFHGGVSAEVWGFSQYDAQFEFDQFWKLPPQDAIRQIYSACDIFLKASQYEGAPGPDMEAMACGLPVCRAIGKGADHLHDDQNCLRVEYGDFDLFYINLRRLADDADLRARLRAAGLKYAANYDWPGAVDGVELALTGAVTPEAAPAPDYTYDLSAYNEMQPVITAWETPQAMFLGEWLRQRLQPRSVLDVGCGPGIYLVPFKPEARVLGVDGAGDAGQALARNEFMRVDLREDWRPVADYDLALCIEVAEHLPPDRADYIVDLLTTAADNVFFSAARPGQPGTMHFNLQTREWWQAKFAARGFEPHPLDTELQAALWDNEHVRRVEWLLHNSFLWRRKETADAAASQ